MMLWPIYYVDRERILYTYTHTHKLTDRDRQNTRSDKLIGFICAVFGRRERERGRQVLSTLAAIVASQLES
jgi:hypothetical protein